MEKVNPPINLIGYKNKDKVQCHHHYVQRFDIKLNAFIIVCDKCGHRASKFRKTQRLYV